MIGFPDAVRRGFHRYATFSGRAQRSEYWWFVLFGFAGNVVAGILDQAIGAGGLQPLSTLFSLGILLPSLAVTVRRLHDIDRTGWWWWIILIPLLGFIVLLVFHSLRGSEGSNRYGPDPLKHAGDPMADPQSYSHSRIPPVHRR